MPGLFFLGEENLVEPAVFAVSAQVHVGVYSRNNARLAVLPDGVLAFPVDLGLAARVAPDVEVVFVEMGGQVLVVKSHGAINHGLHAIVPLDEVAELAHAVDELAARPVTAHLNVKHGDEVLDGFEGILREVLKLGIDGRCRGDIVIASHEQAIVPGLGDVGGVMRRAVGSPLGSLDVDEADVLVTAHLGPIDDALMARDVDAVITGLGVARGHTFGG